MKICQRLVDSNSVAALSCLTARTWTWKKTHWTTSAALDHCYDTGVLLPRWELNTFWYWRVSFTHPALYLDQTEEGKKLNNNLQLTTTSEGRNQLCPYILSNLSSVWCPISLMTKSTVEMIHVAVCVQIRAAMIQRHWQQSEDYLGNEILLVCK